MSDSNVTTYYQQYSADSTINISTTSDRIEPNFSVFRQDYLMERRVIAEVATEEEALTFCDTYVNMIDLDGDELIILDHSETGETVYEPPTK